MKNTINLLPKKNPEEERAKRKKHLIFSSVAACFIILIGIWLVLFLYLQTLKSKQARLVLDIQTKEQNIRGLADTERLYKNVFNKAAAALNLLRNKGLFTQRVDNVKSVINEGVEIRGITIDKKKVKVTAAAADIASIMQYLHNLEDENFGLRVYKNLTISSILINSSIGYEVKIEGDLEI